MTKQEQQLLNDLNLTIFDFEEIKANYETEITIFDLENYVFFKNETEWEKHIRFEPYELDWITNNFMDDYIDWERYIEHRKNDRHHYILNNGMVITEW